MTDIMKPALFRKDVIEDTTIDPNKVDYLPEGKKIKRKKVKVKKTISKIVKKIIQKKKK